MVRRGLSVDSVALCFYSPDRCADGGNTEARRHGERGKGEGRGEGEAGEGMVRRGFSVDSVALFRSGRGRSVRQS